MSGLLKSWGDAPDHNRVLRYAPQLIGRGRTQSNSCAGPGGRRNAQHDRPGRRHRRKRCPLRRRFEARGGRARLATLAGGPRGCNMNRILELVLPNILSVACATLGSAMVGWLRNRRIAARMTRDARARVQSLEDAWKSTLERVDTALAEVRTAAACWRSEERREGKRGESGGGEATRS